MDDIETEIGIIYAMIEFYKKKLLVPSEIPNIPDLLKREETKLEVMRNKHPEYFI